MDRNLSAQISHVNDVEAGEAKDPGLTGNA